MVTGKDLRGAAIVARVMETRAQQSEKLAQMRLRQQRGLEIARQCTQILKEQFGVQRVVLFGSLLDLDQMSWRSDIDLVVWGLPEADFLKAGAAIERGHDFSIDLIEIQHAKPHVLKAIEQGIEL
jgi:uncharacterized protein